MKVCLVLHVTSGIKGREQIIRGDHGSKKLYAQADILTLHMCTDYFKNYHFQIILDSTLHSSCLM